MYLILRYKKKSKWKYLRIKLDGLKLDYIYQGDTLDVLKTFPNESIDCDETLPPYLHLTGNNMGDMFMLKRDSKGRFIKGYHYNRETEFKKGQHWREPKKYWEKSWLENEYIIKQKSAEQIAKENGCGTNNILYWLKKHNIPRRSTTEVRKIKFWGLSGKNNPMFGKKGELSPNWKGGITAERQAFYSSKKWKEVCSYVWNRDEATCQRCGLRKTDNPQKSFHIHHIKSFKYKDLRAEPTNLILLCEDCHRFVHSKKNINKEFLN